MKKIIVGLDFDGVVAYNPARLARLPIAVIKRYILGIDKVSFCAENPAATKPLGACPRSTCSLRVALRCSEK